MCVAPTKCILERIGALQSNSVHAVTLCISCNSNADLPMATATPAPPTHACAFTCCSRKSQARTPCGRAETAAAWAAAKGRGGLIPEPIDQGLNKLNCFITHSGPPRMRQNRETLQCCAHSESDCRALIHAARCGLIRRIVARLSNAEKRRIKPGELYIFNEAESGIRRWTDKRVWTPSRVHGIFLIYRDVGGAMVKKTYSCELDDGKYHLVMYGLVEWEESGECCTVFHGVVDQIKLQLGGSAALWAKESKRYGAVADQERWPQDAPAERGGIAAYELLEPVEKLFEHAERSSNANFFPDLCHARAEAPPCAAPAKDSSGIFYPSELPLSDSFARKYFADATGRELCNYFAGAASGQFDSVHADAQPESVASNRRVLDSADILDSLVRPGASTREENLADFNIYLNSILSVDGNDSSPRSRQKSGTAGGPRDRNGESTGDRAGECI